MAERNERPIFEGNIRRVDNHRVVEHGDSKRLYTMLKYLSLVVFIAIFVKIFSL